MLFRSDPEVSYNANQIVQKRLSLGDFMITQLESGRFQQADVEQILLRMPRSEALDLLTAIANRTAAEWAVSLRDDLTNGRKQTRALVPTGSAEGDRYYIQATWDNGSDETIACLAELFTGDTTEEGAVGAEAARLRSQRQRVTYGLSKQWVLEMARQVERCGGRATFVGYGGKYRR